mmetsp:Transcript_7518/g.18046  ORF Transcript_7518/g.18046 Transcript_7518/m.18046 type:complete len:218 (-) Transcript_7518:310-963(-)
MSQTAPPTLRRPGPSPGSPQEPARSSEKQRLPAPPSLQPSPRGVHPRTAVEGRWRCLWRRERPGDLLPSSLRRRSPLRKTERGRRNKGRPLCALMTRPAMRGRERCPANRIAAGHVGGEPRAPGSGCPVTALALRPRKAATRMRVAGICTQQAAPKVWLVGVWLLRTGRAPETRPTQAADARGAGGRWQAGEADAVQAMATTRPRPGEAKMGPRKPP